MEYKFISTKNMDPIPILISIDYIEIEGMTIHGDNLKYPDVVKEFMNEKYPHMSYTIVNGG